MADEQQLQMGEIEQLGDNAQPLGAPAEKPEVPLPTEAPGEADAFAASLDAPLPPIEDFGSNEDAILAPLADGAVNPLELSGPDPHLAASPEQFEGAADIFRKGLRDEAVTPELVRDLLTQNVGIGAVEEMLTRLKGVDDTTKRAAVEQMINNPNLTMDAKITAIQEVTGRPMPSNIVERLALTNTVQEDAALEDLDDSPEFAQAAEAYVAAIHGDAAGYDGRNGSPKEQRQTVIDEIKNLYTQADKDTGLLDFVEQFTPIGSLPTLNKAVARMVEAVEMKYPGFSGDRSFSDKAEPWVMLGESLRGLRERYEKGTPEARAYIARVVVDNLKSNTGLFQDTNDMVTTHVLDSIFHKELTGEAYPDKAELYVSKETGNALTRQYKIRGVERYFDDAFNVLDAIGAGAVAKTSLAAGARWLPGSTKRALRATPKSATELLAAAAQDGRIAKKMGLTQNDVIQSFLMSPGESFSKAIADDGANGFAVLSARQADATETALQMAKPVNLTALERSKAFDELGEEFGYLLAKPKVKGHVNLSSIKALPDGNGVELSAVFGRTTTRGWATVANAKKAKLDAVENVFGKDAPVELVHQNPQTLQWEVADNLPDNTKGNFFLRAKDERLYDTAPKTFGAIDMADDTVGKLTFGAAVSKWTSALNVFEPFVYNLVSSRVREWRGLQNTMRGQLRSISDLKHPQQQMLSKIVKENEGKVLGDAELHRLSGGDQKVIEGYKSFRHVADTMYTMADKGLRGQYFREGMKDIRVGGARVGWGKPIEQSRSEAHIGESVFDPAKGVHYRLSQQRVRKLYKDGDTLVSMRYHIDGQAGESSRLLLHRKADGAETLPLPHSGVLPKIEAYYPHMTQGNYYVVSRRADGTRKMMGVATNKTDATEFINRYKKVAANRAARGANTRFANMEIVDAPELRAMDDWAAQLDEIYQTNGGPVYGKREGGSIRNLSKDYGASELDPIAALLRGTEIVSASVTKGELIASMRQRLYNYLQRNKGLMVNPETMAHQINDSNISRGFSDPRKVDTARAMMGQIELMEGSPDAWRALTKGVYRRMAHYAYELAERGVLPRNVGRKAQSSLAELAKKGADPAGAFMGVTHRVYVALNAITQFFLQGAQSLVAASYSAKGYAVASRQVMPVLAGVSMRLNSLHGAKLLPQATAAMTKDFTLLAKAAGMSVQEYSAVVEAAVQRGLIDSVAHNTAISDAIGGAAERSMKNKASRINRPGAMDAIKDALRKADTATFGTLSKLGFQGGEDINQIMTMLTIHADDKLKGVADITKSAYVDSLIGRTAHITGNMVKEASPAYNRSLVKPLFQWLQFQHKMALMTMPAKMGGSTILTGAQKAKMALTQFMLFGTNATAISFLLKKGIESQIVEKMEAEGGTDASTFVNLWRSPAVQQIMDGMVFDYTLNKVFQAIDGDASEDFREFNWSKKFAPGAGVDFLGERLVAIFSRDREGFFGAQGQYASTVGQYAKTVADVAQAQLAGVDTVPFEERAEKLTKQGLMTTLPTYGRFLTMQWVKEHDATIAQGGKVSEGFQSELEGKMHFLFGLDTKDRASYYEALDRLEGEYAPGTGARDQELKNIAEQYWKNLVLYSTKLEPQAPTEEMYDRLMDEYVRNQGLLFSALDVRDGEVVNDLLAAKLESLTGQNGDSAEQQFVQRITQKLAKGDFGAAGPKAAVYLRNTEFVKNDPLYLSMVQDAFDAIVDEPTPENITTGTLSNEQEELE
jgi:hypothetical protein